MFGLVVRREDTSCCPLPWLILTNTMMDEPQSLISETSRGLKAKFYIENYYNIYSHARLSAVY